MGGSCSSSTTAGGTHMRTEAGRCILGTQGVDVSDHPARPGTKVLRVQKSSSEWAGTAVWNFPAAAAGRLHLRLLLQPGHGSVLISLTDHFSTPFDDLDEIHNL